jgi:ligand-binding sensor domain-containing protein
MANKYFIIVILIICFSSSLSAQEKELNYSQKLTITEGLAHNGVTSIFEDSRGFLWFGTYGLELTKE